MKTVLSDLDSYFKLYLPKYIQYKYCMEKGAGEKTDWINGNDLKFCCLYTIFYVISNLLKGSTLIPESSSLNRHQSIFCSY